MNIEISAAPGDVDADNFRNAQIVRNNKLQAEHVPDVTSAPQPTTSRGGVITAHNNLKNNIIEKNYSKADVNTAVAGTKQEHLRW